MEIYKIKELSFSYPQKDKEALANINLNVERGEFVTVCGRSGCGKTTLLRHLKTVLTPYGKRSGKIYFMGELLEKLEQRVQASQIGYVLQSPDNQIVTDKVWHELAFGLESLGMDNKTIRLRVAEMASFFGIHTWFHKNVTELSGGQKQLLNLASVMAMQPSVLILDEPTSQLDPIAAMDFIETVKKINRELGTTIIMTEHRTEEIIPVTDRLVVMEEGCITADGSPESVGKKLSKEKHPMFFVMTSPMQIYAGVQNKLPCPVSVKDGRKWLDLIAGETEVKKENSRAAYGKSSENTAIEMKDVWFKYRKDMPDVIKGLSLKAGKGQLYCIVGGNGSGKTTALSLISGICRPYRGKILIGGKNTAKMNPEELFYNNLGVLPQNPQALFVKKTVEQDLYEMLSGLKLEKQEKESRIREVVELTELNDLLAMHPYDLSGGEQQKAALAKVLLRKPRILLLDEPTKGLDGCFKEKLAELLKGLTRQGAAVIAVSHDIEFCARHADVCAMFFDGSIITENTAKEFFAGNSFYTTAANRMARHICKNAVTVEDVIELCRKSKCRSNI
ncbi:energy-coupling factor transport system ATP-binding protein [Ruminiclostridium sufflavum DSM 19573]|uniref:Energy-coupling factor transport system ATP-binding protein n=1 Tax=Ruminiclostridium sufflavum DSM 19573 TaxID=1121337 RepID=A0A318XLD3_9FIRM|nr:ATP-binding cassette domain-containing protein [Ruminiclostridium sufflavum]PYG87395.1 energy-coupling factor transport system ATP-binding protein [Ruminiclostridium sufflavum DSM 19573]